MQVASRLSTNKYSFDLVILICEIELSFDQFEVPPPFGFVLNTMFEYHNPSFFLAGHRAIFTPWLTSFSSW